jgi:glycosyltransferase involved in cell wall biosynthesis
MGQPRTRSHAAATHAAATNPDVTIDVVLPCLDEAPALRWLLPRLPERYRAVVVDNGSTDGTPAVAAALGATVVHEPRRGYGAAVDTGVRACTGEVVVVMDADGSLDPAELPALVGAVVSGAADLACGRRRPCRPSAGRRHRMPLGSSSWPWHARAGTVLLAAVISGGARTRLHDIAPVRVARRADLVSLAVQDRRCGYPLETIVRAARRGWRIVELDVSYGSRTAGTRSKISGTARGTLTAAIDFARVVLRSASMGPTS